MAQVTFVGACGTVTGSATLIDVAGRRFLVDCGMFQGGEELEARNRRPFPFEPRSLHGVLLTHAHLDHCGLLPKLVAEGFRAPIWCTRPTRPLTAIVLEDAAKLQEEDARYARKKGYSRHADPRALYDSKQARQALELLEPLPFDEAAEPLPGVAVRFRRAGHLLGAASIEIEAKGDGGERKRWLFSGDVGRYDAPILVDPQPPGDAPDALVLESTYGNRRHERGDPLEAFGEIVARTFERGGSVLVPASALGRTQDVLYRLSTLVERGRLDPAAVFVDSPMSNRASEVYRRSTPEFDEELRRKIDDGVDPLAADRFTYCRSVEESKQLNERTQPAVIVASSGMAAGGRIVHHLAHRLRDRRTTVVFVGFQAAGTRGRALLDGATSVSIHGHPVAVKAEIRQIGGLSAHADADELVRWAEALPAPPARTFLNHGEDVARKTLAAALAELGWARPE
ncbi:MAG: MBL fold metallo-hydrolase RNA specificity domain-containing protein, partial [Myxococcota bacterium]